VGNATLRTADGVEINAGDGFVVVACESIEPISMASLRRALSEMWDREYHVLDAWIANLPQRGFGPERAPRGSRQRAPQSLR
jgi:hypothetical protein